MARTQSTILICLLSSLPALPATPSVAIPSPTTASPGDLTGFVVVSGPCPTLSWGAVPGADRYDLALYSFDDQGQVEQSPRLYKQLSGSVTTWTPSLDGCPEPGRRYAWAIRASVDGTLTGWSDSRLFTLSEAPSVTEVEEALEVLRRHLDGVPRRDESSSRAPTADDWHQALATTKTQALAPNRSSEKRLRVRPGKTDTTAEAEDRPNPAIEALRGHSLSADAKSPRTIVVSRDHALALEGDLLVEGHVFKEGYALLHTDGGFSGGNTAVGLDALVSANPDLPSLGGVFNSGLGQRALRNNSDGAFNSAVGGLALYSNTIGEYNTALGALGLLYNTSGDRNTAAGFAALQQNTSGDDNTAVGHRALLTNTLGFENTATGTSALEANTDGDRNTATGFAALTSNTTGLENTALGHSALLANTTASQNTAVGTLALRHNTTGEYNTAVGHGALVSNAGGDSNTVVGHGALMVSQSGSRNTAVGDSALNDLASGGLNVAIGSDALEDLDSGNANIAIGHDAGQALQSGTTNIAVGLSADVGTSASGNIAIGTNAGGTEIGSDNIYLDAFGDAGESETIRIGRPDIHTATFVAGVRGATVGNALQVLVGAGNRLGTISSSRRFKEEIRTMADASAGLHALRPVTFRYRKEAAEGPRPVEFGLIAEEVAEIYPDLVAYDEDGKPYSVRYHVLPAMLLNELQRQHARDLAHRREIEALRDQVAALEAILRQLGEEAR